MVRDLIPAALVEHLASYAQVLGGADRYSGGGQVPGSLQLYGDPGFDTVLLDVARLSVRQVRSASPRPTASPASTAEVRPWPHIVTGPNANTPPASTWQHPRTCLGRSS